MRVVVASRYYLIAREGTMDRARAVLREAGLLPETEGQQGR